MLLQDMRSPASAQAQVSSSGSGSGSGSGSAMTTPRPALRTTAQRIPLLRCAAGLDLAAPTSAAPPIAKTTTTTTFGAAASSAGPVATLVAPPPATAASLFLAKRALERQPMDMDDLCNSLSSLQWLVDMKCDLPSPSCPTSPRMSSSARPGAQQSHHNATLGMGSEHSQDEDASGADECEDSAWEEDLLTNGKWRTDAATKPPVGYATLIYLALKNAGRDKLSLSDIYGFIKDHFLYYAYAEPGWKNSIRHNLSSHKCFKKVVKKDDERGKGGFWSLDENYPAPENKKLKSRRKYQKRPRLESDAFSERLRNAKKDDSPILKRKNKKLAGERSVSLSPPRNGSISHNLLDASDVDVISLIDWSGAGLASRSASPASSFGGSSGRVHTSFSRRTSLLFDGGAASSPLRGSGGSENALSLDDDVDITSVHLQSMGNFTIDADLDLSLVGKKCRIYNTAPLLNGSFNVFALDPAPMGSANHSPTNSLNSSFNFHNGADAAALFFSPEKAAASSSVAAEAAVTAVVCQDLEDSDPQDAITAIPADWL